MEEATEYGIVYLLPQSAADYHLDLWTRIERRFRLTGNAQPNAPAHITLKYRFSSENIEEVENVLSEFASMTKPSPLTIKGFNQFAGTGSHVIFLDVIPTGAVRRKHAALLDRLRSIPLMQWGYFDGPDLHYHVTIANKGLTAANFPDVWTFVNAQSPPNFDLAFDNLALLKINNDIHTVYKTYRMSGVATG